MYRLKKGELVNADFTYQSWKLGYKVLNATMWNLHMSDLRKYCRRCDDVQQLFVTLKRTSAARRKRCVRE